MNELSKLFAIKIMVQELPDAWKGSKRTIIDKIDFLIEQELIGCTPKYSQEINNLNHLIESRL